MIKYAIDQRNRQVFEESTLFRSRADLEEAICSSLLPGPNNGHRSAVVLEDKTVADTIHAGADTYDADIDAWATDLCRRRPLKYDRDGSRLQFLRMNSQ